MKPTDDLIEALRSALMEGAPDLTKDVQAALTNTKVARALEHSTVRAALAREPKPQIYVYLTSGGILEYEVTRGDIEVIEVDWDENMERSIEDWEDVISRLEDIADEKLRDSEIYGAQREIEKLRDYAEAERVRSEESAATRLSEAIQVVHEAGLRVHDGVKGEEVKP